MDGLNIFAVGQGCGRRQIFGEKQKSDLIQEHKQQMFLLSRARQKLFPRPAEFGSRTSGLGGSGRPAPMGPGTDAAWDRSSLWVRPIGTGKSESVPGPRSGFADRRAGRPGLSPVRKATHSDMRCQRQFCPPVSPTAPCVQNSAWLNFLQDRQRHFLPGPSFKILKEIQQLYGSFVCSSVINCSVSRP